MKWDKILLLLAVVVQEDMVHSGRRRLGHRGCRVNVESILQQLQKPQTHTHIKTHT